MTLFCEDRLRRFGFRLLGGKGEWTGGMTGVSSGVSHLWTESGAMFHKDADGGQWVTGYEGERAFTACG